MGTIVVQNIMLFYVLLKLWKHFVDTTKPNFGHYAVFCIALVCSASIFIYANKIMAEILALSLLWMAFEALQKSKLFWFLTCIVLLPFVKPVFVLLPLVFLVLLILHKNGHQAKLIFGLLACFAVSLGYRSFNFHRNGALEFSSIQHINALHYNKYQYDVLRFGAERAEEIHNKIIAEAKELSYAEKVKLYNNALYQDIKAQPAGYFVFHTKGALMGAIDPGRFDLQSVIPAMQNAGFLHRSGGGIWNYLKNLDFFTLILLVPIALFNVLRMVLAVFGFAKGEKTLARSFASFAILYIIIITGPIHASRFMVPVMPFLLFFAFDGLKNSKYFKKPES